MKNKVKNKKILKKLLLIGITIYVFSIFINQQKALNSYKNSQNYYKEQIAQKTTYKQELYNKKANLSSPEYIEQIAREKLDMYYPNERVYIDQ